MNILTEIISNQSSGEGNSNLKLSFDNNTLHAGNNCIFKNSLL